MRASGSAVRGLYRTFQVLPCLSANLWKAERSAAEGSLRTVRMESAGCMDFCRGPAAHRGAAPAVKKAAARKRVVGVMRFILAKTF